MKEELTHIKILLERFFEGQTSNADEQELYRFFRRDDLPDEFIGHKPLMQYFETGLADELGRPEEEAKAHKETKTHRLRNLRIFWGGVAASFLMILSASLYLMKPADPYAGSYIIRNGVRITDLDLIRPELEATVQMVLLQEQMTEQWIEDQFMQQLQEQNNRILDNIQDENIRKEVEEILLTQD